MRTNYVDIFYPNNSADKVILMFVCHWWNISFELDTVLGALHISPFYSLCISMKAYWC
jgi:hypothetical protein